LLRGSFFLTFVALNLDKNESKSHMFEYLRQNRLVFVLSTAFMGLFFQFMIDVIFSLIYRNASIISPWHAYLLSVVMSFIIILGLFRLASLINKRYSWESSPGSRFYIQVVMVVAFIVLGVMILRLILNLVFASGGFIRLLDEIIVAVFFFLFGLLVVFLDIGIILLNKWRFSLAEIERFKKENLETQYEMLRIQVNPHFLFNSLNTLSALIYQNQDTAANFVREMSSVYRYILEKRKSELAPLREEMDFTDSYRYLLSLRFDQKLIFEMDVSEICFDMFIVPLTLQILIENAVKHNIVSLKKPLTIRIFTENDKRLVVQNNLQKKPVTSYSSGIGLENIRSRLAFISGKNLIVIQSETDFIVKIPLISQNELNKKW